MKFTRLLDYSEEYIYRGMVLRCVGKWPYEDIVEFLVCEPIDEDRGFVLMVATGYKAGLINVRLPQECIPPGNVRGLSTLWLKENWSTWGYTDCPIDKVYIYTPVIPKTLNVLS
jgi:hypothetical protein